MSRVITASEPSWIAPFTGLSPRQFGKLVTALRREGAAPVRKGWPWSLPLEDRVLLVAAYWRTNLTLRQLAPLFGTSKSAADRVIDHLGPSLALQQRRRFRKDAVLIVDGTLVPTRDHTIAEQSKNYRYSTNHQVVIDADSQLVVAVGRPLPGNRNDCKAWELSGAKAAVGRATVIADGGYRGTGLLIPHRRERGQTELPAWKDAESSTELDWVWLACRDAANWRFADVAARGGGLLVASGPDVAELTLLPLGQVAGHGMTLSRT